MSNQTCKHVHACANKKWHTNTSKLLELSEAAVLKCHTFHMLRKKNIFQDYVYHSITKTICFVSMPEMAKRMKNFRLRSVRYLKNVHNRIRKCNTMDFSKQQLRHTCRVFRRKSPCFLSITPPEMCQKCS